MFLFVSLRKGARNYAWYDVDTVAVHIFRTADDEGEGGQVCKYDVYTTLTKVFSKEF